MSKSYVKNYENGILTNPITKNKPFIVDPRPDKKKTRLSNNRKGKGLVVVKMGPLLFMKYEIVKQRVLNGLVVNSILKQ